MINEEDIFKLIQSEKWDQLTTFISKNKKEIKTNPVLKYAADTFVSEFLRKTEIVTPKNSNISDNLETLYAIHLSKYYVLTEDQLKTLVCRIVAWKINDLIYVYNYAQLYPKEEICARVIEEYKKTVPIEVEHSQSNEIKVTESKKRSEIDCRINLFKSPQEIEFFNALKQTFPTYHIYPNVAISCLLNWGILKHDLTDEEKKFFFKGIVDFVVFDQAQGYIPIYFFELDSSHHDDPEVLKKDKIKDSIFSLSGVKLIRIRKQQKKIGVEEFTKLIREIIK